MEITLGAVGFAEWATVLSVERRVGHNDQEPISQEPQW